MHFDGGRLKREKKKEWNRQMHRERVLLQFCTFCTHTWTCSHTQITAASLRLHCSVFMIRRANISMGLGMYVGSRWKEGNEGDGGVKKRRRYLRYYTHPGECSVEQALWECKLHSLLLPLGCRLLDEYNHPQHQAPRHTPDTSRILDRLPQCVYVNYHASLQSFIDSCISSSASPFLNDVKYWHITHSSQLGEINSESPGLVKHPASSGLASKVVGGRNTWVFAKWNSQNNSSLELKQECSSR